MQGGSCKGQHCCCSCGLVGPEKIGGKERKIENKGEGGK